MGAVAGNPLAVLLTAEIEDLSADIAEDEEKELEEVV